MVQVRIRRHSRCLSPQPKSERPERVHSDDQRQLSWQAVEEVCHLIMNGEEALGLPG
jgi:hypothetical protein